MPRRRPLAQHIRLLARLHRPTAPMWRRRIAILGGAVAIGLVALLFAHAADMAGHAFARLAARWRWAPLIATPAGFILLVWLTRRYVPEARGSGIPQVMAATHAPDGAMAKLLSARTVIAKLVFTVAAMLVGGSVGREGPTVQLGASIMGYAHRLMRIPLRASVFIAGGAAGVAAAFNTPLAGVAFAIEELAAAYEQRMTLLVMAAVLIAGMVSLGIAGDYVYFGVIAQGLPPARAMLIAPLAGLFGGLAGALFSRGLLGFGRAKTGPVAWAQAHPIATAGLCGLVVAAIGIASGLSWGTGYEAARTIVQGGDLPWWYGPAKFVATLATALSGLPGGIFAPSLSTGAGLGQLLRFVFPDDPAGAIALLGMVAYFTGVVRAPLTAVIIISETTGSRALLLPLLAAALVADFAAQMVSKEKLYHGLSKRFVA
jgi:H+/Cl- antiporter ClcA